MTRKDYEVFAETVRVLRWNLNSRAEWEVVRGAIADTFARDSARFDRERFIAACENPKVNEPCPCAFCTCGSPEGRVQA